MPRHPRDRWEFPNGPDDHSFVYPFDNPGPLGYDQGQERPYSCYGPYDYADVYRKRPDYDPQFYPTHDDFLQNDEGNVEDLVPEESQEEEREGDDEDLVVIRRPWRPRSINSHTDGKTNTSQTTGVGSSGIGLRGASRNGDGTNESRQNAPTEASTEHVLVPEPIVQTQQPDDEIGPAPLSIFPGKICQEIASLLAYGVSTAESKEISKAFQLKFKEEGLSIFPPKLYGWMSRRAKEKVFSNSLAPEKKRS
ncbi:hypothetical protein DAPPUDRAFT_106755 [Daphnia pulex]|uniref:Uncharacterized protein n=1 Tax=Daphnia pulex TaxID=6669 RepID=E9GUH7_DAPPU|nr:hypothetical protein DAPPUDRAFT_106755 [Daphnia pulex]|eukprot:EFX76834.1 hypothetical protein DAPPUDRAFT_106755 [Daphnia pulex]